MLSLRNRLLQKSAFLRHNHIIELGKRYVALHKSAHIKQLSPALSFYALYGFKHKKFSTYPQIVYDSDVKIYLNSWRYIQKIDITFNNKIN